MLFQGRAKGAPKRAARHVWRRLFPWQTRPRWLPSIRFLAGL